MADDDILHVTTPAAWDEARATGRVRPPSLDHEGFVHCSTRAQLPGTLARHFAGQGPLLVLVLDPDRLDAPLRWEAAGGGPPFPHVYGPLPVEAVTATEPA
jgi:uncharacterized protein (DUF952 family)